MKTKTYNFYMDPGHGWMRVPRTELTQLGIADKITNYSYQRGSFVYLEEDCDATTFIHAKRSDGFDVRFREFTSNRSSKIRSYESYYFIKEAA